jgi:hypothetical protein
VKAQEAKRRWLWTATATRVHAHRAEDHPVGAKDSATNSSLSWPT